MLYRSAVIMACFGNLRQAGTDADGGLFTFTSCLPEPYVIGKLVHMAFKPLLAFFYAPYPNALFDEPFHNKGRFAFNASQPVKHKDQQNIKFVSHSLLLQDLNCIPILGGNLKSGYALFGKLVYEMPALLGDVCMASLALHGDIVPKFIYLAQGGHPV